jgi:alpha-galactosidase
MQFHQAILQVGSDVRQLTPGRLNSYDDLYVDFQQDISGHTQRLNLFIHPKQDVVIERLELQFVLNLPAQARFFANGYQSWSESRLHQVGETIPRLRPIARTRMGFYGDEMIGLVPRGKGKLHAWTYGYVEQSGGQITLFGSLNEKTGFTLFSYDVATGILKIRKDFEHFPLQHSFPAMNIWIGTGKTEEMFDWYFESMEIPAHHAEPAIGWTSWYRHFVDIDEAKLLHDLDGFAALYEESGVKTKAFFQIDDGWQTAVGDWRSVKPTFPKGMTWMAGQIRAKDLLPGLWLAPFVAAGHSDLVRRNPEWLLKDKNGKLIRVGWNPLWKTKPGMFGPGGWYYALDFYNPAVQDYLSGIFHVILEKWGFELLKLDFLFAVCLAPPPGKNRGQVMSEAMEFLRKLIGSKKMLACGVPLGSAFGLADYCRIGGDIHVGWEHTLLATLRHRERVSTIASLRSTLSRWQLNGRAFHNDPDVFILRTEGQNLTPVQQNTVLTINALLGDLLFCSDDVSAYSDEQRCEILEAWRLHRAKVSAVMDLGADLYRIDFQESDQKKNAYCAFCNLSAVGKQVGHKQVSVALMPFETIIVAV